MCNPEWFRPVRAYLEPHSCCSERVGAECRHEDSILFVVPIVLKCYWYYICGIQTFFISDYFSSFGHLVVLVPH